MTMMLDANPDTSNLDNFGRWYEQPGTPVLTVEQTSLDPATSTYAITFSQKNYDLQSQTPGTLLPPLTIPIRTSIFDKDSGALLDTSLLVLDQHQQTFYFHDVTAAAVVVSPLQTFSAPVRLVFPQQTEADLSFLLTHDTDPFNRWECQQRASSRVMLRVAAAGDAAAVRQMELPAQYVEAFKQTLLSVKVNCVLRSSATLVVTMLVFYFFIFEICFVVVAILLGHPTGRVGHSGCPADAPLLLLSVSAAGGSHQDSQGAGAGGEGGGH
jgi:aminopeptidase N